MFAMLVLMATPVMAGTFDTIAGWFGPIGSALAWLANATGATDTVVNWSVGTITAIFAAWILKKIPNHRVAWPFEKLFYGLGVTMTLGLAKWKWTSSWWNDHGEPWFVDLIQNIVKASVDAWIRGMRSDN